ncbi:hypothetical protein [Nitrincola sp. A-D6]|uniref:hypothetical protein n=1 Tax=Nitrincola sp. A-D6 TaxID=1545442 RepID=UPI00190F0F4F|nr:hypothetical protein [Nitrincola sp. A-D6]
MWTEPEELTLPNLQALQPTKVFFPHWNWVVPNEILQCFTCICFHMTALPYGRGGSPLQNLILKGHQDTQLTALKMTPELDAGPTYAQETLSLAGSAQDIFERAAPLVYKLIEKILTEDVQPVAQKGEVVYFKRRNPEQSELPSGLSKLATYDFIRMLDAEGYPKAFVRCQERRIELSQAKINSSGVLTAQAHFIEEGNE